MSRAVDRMRARREDRLAGVAMPSLLAPSDRLPAYAPSLASPGAPIATSLDMKLRAPNMSLSTTPAYAEPKKPNFFMRDAFGGLKVWQVMLGGVGVLAVGVGVYKIAASPSRMMRAR